MRRAADTGRALAQLANVAACVGDQFLRRFHRQFVGDHQDVWNRCDDDDRREVAGNVEARALFLKRSGLIVSVCGAPSTSVWPSAGARAASAMPMLPLAPLRLSTTKGWPSTACRRSAMARATMSVAPPGGKGTISRTGRLG